jgi:prevent-host-death family protein
MSAITMTEARAHLSRWVDAIVRGDEQEIVIARHGRPAARLVAIEAVAPVGEPSRRIRVAKGLFEVTHEPNPSA